MGVRCGVCGRKENIFLAMEMDYRYLRARIRNDEIRIIISTENSNKKSGKEIVNKIEDLMGMNESNNRREYSITRTHHKIGEDDQGNSGKNGC